MRKLKIAVAILVVLFACQAVFADFVPAQKADPAVTNQLARACDVLQTMALTQDDPVAFYMSAATADDATIGVILAIYPPLGYEPVTTTEELAKIFPRGVEATDAINAVRRAAIHLAAYNVSKGPLFDTALIQKAEASFQIVGYKYLVRLEGNTIMFDFIDIYSKEELEAIAALLSAFLPGVSAVTFPEYGEIDIVTEGITEFGFRQFVANARSLMYTLIYY